MLPVRLLFRSLAAMLLVITAACSDTTQPVSPISARSARAAHLVGSGGGSSANPNDLSASTYCAESQCVGVSGAYISHFTRGDCTGAESYYTPYDGGNGGVRRSWDGGGLAGTVLRTVTNRSWKDASGTCHADAWPNGNTLDGFVTIYRYACGETTCARVEDAYISHFTGAGCTGTESYYTAYNNFDGVRRSWDGGGIVGTTVNTVTNMSYKDNTGTCYDAWPSGNTLGDFVTVYRQPPARLYF